MKCPEGCARTLVATIGLLFVVFGATAACAGATFVGVIGASSKPATHHPCVAFYPRFYKIVVGTPGNSDVGGVDASGCDSWVYQILNLGIPQGFFAGSDFRPGVTAYEYGSLESTLWIGNRQAIRVVDPTADWLAAYDGFDSCRESSPTHERVCEAAAVSPRPTDWYWFAGSVAALVVLLCFVLHNVRPAGPIRRRRRFTRHQRGLAAVVGDRGVRVLTPRQLRELERRLRRLERVIASQLSESQHRWFVQHLASGRPGVALETLARWIVDQLPHVPEPVREEFEWLAVDLEMQEALATILDGPRLGTGTPAERQMLAGEAHNAIDVPIERFRSLVAQALDSLPDEVGLAMRNVAVIVEDEPATPPVYSRYVGVPLSRRDLHWNVHPDRILIYRTTICAYSISEEEVKQRVYVSVVHAVAHHFGIADARLTELGW